MKLLNSYTIGIGIVAGVIAAFIAIFSINLLMFLPFISLFCACLISLPIFVTAFGWGTVCSFIAVVSASLVLLLIGNIQLSLSFFLLFFAPAFYAAWLLGFAQSDENGKIKKWFPLSSVLFTLATFIAMINVFIGLYFYNNKDMPMIAEIMANTMVASIEQTQTVPSLDLNIFKELFIANIVPLISVVLALFSILFLIGNLYFSVITAQKMQRLARPKDDWPTSLRLPLQALIVLAVAVLISFVHTNTILDLIALVFSTVFTYAFSITGLAYLHNITRDINGRTFILSFVYIGLFTVIFALPISIILLLLGIWATIQQSHQNSGLKI